ncbi:unnamed protein product [Withania somnifera]
MTKSSPRYQENPWSNPHELITWNPRTDGCDNWTQATLSCDDTTNRITVGIYILQLRVPAIGDLTYLQSLDIAKFFNLLGPIPLTIAKLTNLTFLKIIKTNISGLIPEFLCTELKNITYINLSDNNLVGQLSNLLYLSLDRNKLTGPITESFGKLTPKLEFLYLGHNKVSGVVPRSFTAWDFETLDLSDNKLEGDICFLFGKDSNTFQLYFLNLGKKIVSLKLNHNPIYGGFPEGFASRPWQEFNVCYNNLCGKIPQGGLYMIRFDMYSYIHNKCLRGYLLPPCNSA